MATTKNLAAFQALAGVRGITYVPVAAPTESPNSMIYVEWLSAGGNTFFESYDHVADNARWAALLRMVDSWDEIVAEMLVEAAAAIAAAGAPPYTYADYQALVQGLREIAEIAASPTH